MAIKSRRIKNVMVDGELPPDKNYCRKCTKIKQNGEFFSAVDLILDTNKLMSICSDCIGKLFEKTLESENGNLQKTILHLCKMLNVLYSEQAITDSLKVIETRNMDKSKFFGVYKSRLFMTKRSSVNDSQDDINLTYKDNPIINNNTIVSEFEVDPEVVDFWGSGYEKEDYRWLEKTLAEWKRTHKSDTMGEQTLLREIVFKQLEIEKSRKVGFSSGSLIKELQDLMKTASVDPAKSNIAGSGKSQDTFSAFIKMIEENEPADYYKDKELFKDFDNIDRYFQKYILRPLKNFITGSRDFNVDSEDESLDENLDDIDIEKLLETENETDMK